MEAAGKLFGILLNPSLKGHLKGYILLPKMEFNEESEETYVECIEFIPYDRINYPVNSMFIFNSGLVPVVLPSIDDPKHRDQAFAMLNKMLLNGTAFPKLQNGKPWFAFADLKRSGDVVAFCGSYDDMSRVLNAPLFDLKDIIKSSKVLLPPSRIQIIGAKGLVKKGHLRVYLAKLEDILSDGGIVGNIQLKHADYDPDGKVGPMHNTKDSWQLRHNTFKEMDGHKKGKYTFSPSLFRLMCRKAGVDHRTCDAIMAHDNIKSTSKYKAGDIAELAIDEIRIIKCKERSTPTRGGSQLRRIPWSALRALMAEKSDVNVASATVMRYASKGNAHAIAHILQVPFCIIQPPLPELKAALEVLADDISKDAKQYFEDGLGLFTQLLGAAKWTEDPDGGYYKVPMYGDPFAAVMGRLRTWYFDNVIKIKLGDFSFYVEVAPHLKKSECILPNVPELLDVANTEGIHLTGMRPPIVSRGNLQPLTPKRKPNGVIKTNNTNDTIFVGAELLLSMFGDTDGDMLYIIQSGVKFKYRPRKVVDSAKPKQMATTPEELCDLITAKASQVAKASLTVGLLDATASRIYDERQLSGNPLSDDESFRLAEVLEGGIKSFKHDGTLMTDEEQIALMCWEFGTDNIRKTRALPKKALPQTQLFRRKFGAFGSEAKSDKVKMNSLAFELERFYAYGPNKDAGLCVNGPNQHPHLPIFEALRGFVYNEDYDRVAVDHEALTALWEKTKSWLEGKKKDFHFKIIDRVKHIESLYNSSASFAIALSSYNGEKPETWWPFCIYTSIQNRRDWAGHIYKNKMLFQFKKTSNKGYVNNMSGYVTKDELFELLSTGRINTLQKRARFRAIREAVELYIEQQIPILQTYLNLSHDMMYKCIATALAYRVFGMKKSGSGIRNAREFMCIKDEAKLSVYNSSFGSPWGKVAASMWEDLKAHFKDIEDQKALNDEADAIESVDGDVSEDDIGE